RETARDGRLLRLRFRNRLRGTASRQRKDCARDEHEARNQIFGGHTHFLFNNSKTTDFLAAAAAALRDLPVPAAACGVHRCAAATRWPAPSRCRFDSRPAQQQVAVAAPPAEPARPPPEVPAAVA